MLCLVLFFVLCVFSQTAFADLPLAVENLITAQQKFKINATLAYANHEQQQVVVSGYQLIQTGPSSFIRIPTTIEQTSVNSDTLILTTSLHYGLSANLEISLRASQQHSETRSGTTLKKEDRFVDSWIGMSYQISSDNETPALLGSFEMALQEKDPIHQNISSAKSFALGITTYRAIDPVVLSLSTIYQAHAPRNRGNQRYKPSDFFILNPSVSFVANDSVTLINGVQWQSKKPDSFDGKEVGLTHTSTQLLLGLGYVLAPNQFS